MAKIAPVKGSQISDSLVVVLGGVQVKVGEEWYFIGEKDLLKLIKEKVWDKVETSSQVFKKDRLLILKK